MKPMTAARAGLVLVATVMFGCTEDGPTGGTPTPITFTLVTTRQWSGGAITLRSSQANAGHAPRLVYAGDDSTTATPVGDTTYRFTLPTGPSGPVLIRVGLSGGGVDTAGTVTRVGYTNTLTLDGPIFGLSGWSPDGRPAILGYEQGSYLLASADLQTGTVTEFPGLTVAGTPFYPVSPGFAAGTVAARDSLTDSSTAWRLTPTIARLAVLSGDDQFNARQVVWLNDSLVLRTYHHSARLDRVNGQFVRTIELEEPHRVSFSPSRHFITVTAAASFGHFGVTVFDARSGDSLFVIPLGRMSGVAFSQDEQVVYGVGDGSPESDSLVAVSTASGATLRRTALPVGAKGLAALDDDATGQIFLTAALNGNAGVLVYDASTLELRGTLTTDQGCGAYCEGTSLFDQSGHKIYFAGAEGTPQQIHVFDAIP